MKKFIVILVGIVVSSLVADITIDAQIEKIQKAPAKERVKLMNQFKQRLVVMNQEQRKKAIEKMRIKIQSKRKVQETSLEMAQVNMRLQERTKEKQIQNSMQINSMQNMNQHQAGSQHRAGEGFINSANSGSKNRINFNVNTHN